MAGRPPARAARAPARPLAVLAAVLVALCALPVLLTVPRGTAPVQLNAESEEADGGLAGALRFMHEAVLPLQKEVDAGNLVAKFGEKANSVLSQVASRASEAEKAADGVLHSLFLRQLAILRRQLAVRPERSAKPVEVVSQADQQFVARAEELKRPGSDWSYDNERYTLRAILEGGYRRAAALDEQRMLAAQSQQSTSDIIGKLQSQMENLQQRVQAMRAGSPWFLSSSYRIPGTPFQLIGRYQQGRANFELSLNPDKDPANSEAGFVSGLGPANLGVAVNLGI